MKLSLQHKTEPVPAGSGEYNPYLADRREWDERYGDQITRARNWRTMAMLSGLVSLLTTAGLLWRVPARRMSLGSLMR